MSVMEKVFHHKKTSVTIPISLGKQTVHNIYNFMEMLVKQYPGYRFTNISIKLC